jgi:hypothetical protein
MGLRLHCENLPHGQRVVTEVDPAPGTDLEHLAGESREHPTTVRRAPCVLCLLAGPRLVPSEPSVVGGVASSDSIALRGYRAYGGGTDAPRR